VTRAGRLAVAALVGTCVGVSGAALGHRAPGGRSVVAQIEPCSLALLISWTPPSGDETDALLGQAMLGALRMPGSSGAAADPDARLRLLYTVRALAPLSIRVDGQPTAATSLDVKLVRDPPTSTRVAAVLLVTYDLPPATRSVEIANADPHRTRFSWVDRSRGRFALPGVAEETWSSGVASILLRSRAGDSWPSCPDASSP
jgi:hypothetical protein